jgi:hypothetical protein
MCNLNSFGFVVGDVLDEVVCIRLFPIPGAAGGATDAAEGSTVRVVVVSFHVARGGPGVCVDCAYTVGFYCLVGPSASEFDGWLQQDHVWHTRHFLTDLALNLQHLISTSVPRKSYLAAHPHLAIIIPIPHILRSRIRAPRTLRLN